MLSGSNLAMMQRLFEFIQQAVDMLLGERNDSRIVTRIPRFEKVVTGAGVESADRHRPNLRKRVQAKPVTNVRFGS
jgi:hypothetical protein